MFAECIQSNPINLSSGVLKQDNTELGMEFVQNLDNGSPIENSDQCFKVEKEHNAMNDTDADVANQSKILNDTLLNTYHSIQSHLITIKKRMLEEKEFAMMEAERVYLNNYDKFQSEIATLKEDISCKETENLKNTNKFSLLSEKSACLMENLSRKYSSSLSISKIFRSWADLTLSTKRSDHLDKVAQTFARKHILAKYFYSLCLSIQRRKLYKINAEAKFKFDSVTTEMVTSYESELEDVRRDLREAYLTIEAEQLRRRQLEEDLRGMFLKNMTAMNFEALSLFQNAHNMVDPDRLARPGMFSNGYGGGPGTAVASPPRPVRRDLATPVASTSASSPVRSTTSSRGSRSPLHMGCSADSLSPVTRGTQATAGGDYVTQLSASYRSTLSVTPHLAHHSSSSLTPSSAAVESVELRHVTPSSRPLSSTPSSAPRHSGRIPPGSSGSRSTTSPSSRPDMSHRRPFH